MKSPIFNHMISKENRIKTVLAAILLIVFGCLLFMRIKMDRAAKLLESEVSAPIEQNVQSFNGSEIKTIGISMPAAQLERWHIDTDLLKGLFENAGYKVLVSYGDNLIDTQINDINRMIENGAQLLVIAPADSNSLGATMELCAKENIPVFAYDRMIADAPNLVAYISYDNYRIGQIQGQYIVDMLDLNGNPDSKFNIEIFSGDPADNNSIYFYDGAMDVLNPYIEAGRLKILSGRHSFYGCSITSWDMTTAQERMDILVSSYYNKEDQLDAVLCPNDSIALGVCNALKTSYKKTNPIIVTGQDCDPDNIQYIKDGLQTMSIRKDFHNEALTTYYVVDSYLKGHPTDDDLTADNSFDFVVTRKVLYFDNDEYSIASYLLTPEVVTSENVDGLIDIEINKYPNQ